MSADAEVYADIGLNADDIAHVLEMSRRARDSLKTPPGKLSSRMLPHGPPPKDALSDYQFPGESESTADLLARQAAYQRAENDGLVRHYRK